VIIYKILNTVNNKVYIGQTIRPLKDRWRQHLRDCKNNVDNLIYRAIRKYGKENFTIEEIDGANSLSELNYLEKHYICKFESLSSENGYNILPGGKNFKMPQWIKNKISKANKGKKKKRHISKEEKSRIAKENASKLKYDKNWAIKNGSKPFKVYKAICTREGKRNVSAIHKKGKYIGEWLMTTECGKDLNITPNHIRSCLIGKRKQHCGYIFERI